LSDVLQPDIAAEPGCGFAFHLHAVIGMRFFALWPFTRRVDAFSAPLNYLFRPYIVYRPRDAHPGSRPRRRAWDSSAPMPSRR